MCQVTQEIVCVVMELQNIIVILKISKLQQQVAGSYPLEIESGDVQSIFKSLSEAIANLFNVIDNGDSAKINFAKLVLSIKITMPGLGPVSPLFNSQLKSLREYWVQRY